MRRALSSTSWVACLVLLASGPACSESTEPTAVTVEALEGHWKAISLTYRDLTDTSQSLEMVQTGGQTVDLTFDGMAYARVDTFPTPRFAVAIDSGAVVLTGEGLGFASRLQDTLTVHATFDGSRLVLTDTVSMRLFCPSGCAAPVAVRYRFRREGV